MIYLPEMIDKIKDTIEGLKGNWQDYEAHKAETKADNVHGLQDLVAALTGLFGMEIGQNENGNWVRWNNGLQICWGETSFDTAMPSPPSSALGNTGNRNITMPIEFAEPPISTVFISGKTEIPNVFTMGANSPNTVDTIRFRFASLHPESAIMTYYVHYIAIGWWKTPENPTEWSEE